MTVDARTTISVASPARISFAVSTPPIERILTGVPVRTS